MDRPNALRGKIVLTNIMESLHCVIEGYCNRNNIKLNSLELQVALPLEGGSTDWRFNVNIDNASDDHINFIYRELNIHKRSIERNEQDINWYFYQNQQGNY